MSIFSGIYDAIDKLSALLFKDYKKILDRLNYIDYQNVQIIDKIHSLKNKLNRLLTTQILPSPVTFTFTKETAMITATALVKATDPADKLVKQTLKVTANGVETVKEDIAADQDVQVTFEFPNDAEDTDITYSLTDFDNGGNATATRNGTARIETTGQVTPGEVGFTFVKTPDAPVS